MPAVQGPLRSIDSYINILIAAHAEHNFFASRLMHRSVADDPGVRLKQVLMQIDDFAEVGRARFFFTFEKKFDVE